MNVRKALVIRPDGTAYWLTLDGDDYEPLKEAIGGLITTFPARIPGGSRIDAFADDEGLLKPDPRLNPLATALYGSSVLKTPAGWMVTGNAIVGTVVLFGETDLEAETPASFTDELLAELERFAESAGLPLSLGEPVDAT